MTQYFNYQRSKDGRWEGGLYREGGTSGVIGVWIRPLYRDPENGRAVVSEMEYDGLEDAKVARDYARTTGLPATLNPQDFPDFWHGEPGEDPREELYAYADGQMVAEG